MSTTVSRRDALKTLGAAGAGMAIARGTFAWQQTAIFGDNHPIALQWTAYDDTTIRLQFNRAETPLPLAETGALVRRTGATGRSGFGGAMQAGSFKLVLAPESPSIAIQS